MRIIDKPSMKSKKEFGFNSYVRTQSRRLADDQNKLNKCEFKRALVNKWMRSRGEFQGATQATAWCEQGNR